MHRAQGFQCSENILYDVIVVDTCHYIIVSPITQFMKAALGITHRTFYTGKNKAKIPYLLRLAIRITMNRVVLELKNYDFVGLHLKVKYRRHHRGQI